MEDDNQPKKHHEVTPAITVLQEGDVEVKYAAGQYTVYTNGKSPGYFTTPAGFMWDVSTRLFSKKLSKRAEEGKRDIASFCEMFVEFRKEIEEKFRL